MRTTGQRIGVTALLALQLCTGLVGCLSGPGDFRTAQHAPGMHPSATRPTSGGYHAPAAMSMAPAAASHVQQHPSPRQAPAVRQAAHVGDQGHVVRAQAVVPESHVPGMAPNANAPQVIDVAPGMVGPHGNLVPPGMVGPHGNGIQPPSLADFGAPPPPGFDGPRPLPNELVPTSHPPYRVAPPDILLIDALRVVPRGPYALEPLEVLTINVSDTLPNQAISGPFMIGPDGRVNLGFTYGSVRVGGMTLEQAQQAIFNHLSNILKNPTVNLAVTQFRGMQQIAGQHLVRPDGTISLGSYGSVYVAGLTLGQIKCVLEKYLGEYLLNPQVSVDVLAYNSQKIYVILDGGGFGQQVIPLPVTGNETVLDAISSIGGVSSVSSKKRIWVARPQPCNQNCNVILPVDWQAITMNGQTCTNYQLFPGDRVYVSANRLIAFDNYLSQVLQPINRMLGTVLLYQSVINSFSGNGGNEGFIVGGF